MTKFELNKLDIIKDGRIIIYQHPRKDGSVIPMWQMRISVPNFTGYKRSSTGGGGVVSDKSENILIGYTKWLLKNG